MPLSLSSADEDHLMQGVKQAVHLVDSEGIEPDDALHKVAVQMKYTPGFLKAACNAYNTGRQLAQLESSDSILDKLANFPLANYENIHDRIWGQKDEPAEKTAACATLPRFLTYDEKIRRECLERPLPVMQKTASEQELHPAVASELRDRRMKKAFDALAQAQRMHEHERHLKGAAGIQLDRSIQALEQYFTKSAFDRLPFAQVEQAVGLYYGQPGKTLVNYLAEKFPGEKRASDFRASWEGFAAPVDRSREPYTLVAAAIEAAKNWHKTAAAEKLAADKVAQAQANVSSFIQAPAVKPAQEQATESPYLIPEKQASLPAAAAGGATFGLVGQLANKAKLDNENQLAGQLASLDSPDHLNELRRIQAQTVLTSAMSDPDDPLSQYDPEEVLAHYNQMVRLAPRLADQPSAVSTLLRKRLVGNVEPFELGETLKLEEGLTKTQSPPYMDLMKNADSILG
jgi:hypothetical protein